MSSPKAREALRTIPPQPVSRNLRIFIIAAEESGDRLGAALIAALREQAGNSIEVAGVGGRAMAAEGILSLFPIDDLAIVGFGIVRKLPMILSRIRQTAEAAIAMRPDVLVIIDSPDFTHRVARRVRTAAADIPIVDYVSPTVWAWRPGRARAMRGYIDHILALLPFEPAVHAELGGPPCTFVGHPLSESIGRLRPNAAEAERRLADPPVVLMLPGSRRSEIARMLPVFADAMDLLDRKRGPLELVIPTVPHLAESIRQAAASWRVRPRVIVDADEKSAAFRNACVALAKSGTVTLELALAGVPMVAAYRVSCIEAFVVRRMIRMPAAFHVHSVILPNLVLGDQVVPEFLQEACTPEALADAVTKIIDDRPERRRQVEAFARLDAIMQTGSSRPSREAAAIILELADARRS